jgi:Integrase core domain
MAEALFTLSNGSRTGQIYISSTDDTTGCPTSFFTMALDLIGELPTTLRGNRWLLVTIDYTTNWPIARPLPDATGEAVAKFIYEEIVVRFGCLTEILTDRDSNFMSKLVEQYLQRLQTKHKRTSAFHPRTNGKCERLNGILKNMLRTYCNSNINRWDDFVDTALFGKNLYSQSYGQEPVLLDVWQGACHPGDPLTVRRQEIQ